MVCPMDFELRNPQDTIRYKGADKQSFPDSRPRNVLYVGLGEQGYMLGESGEYILDENGNRIMLEQIEPNPHQVTMKDVLGH